ETFLKARNVVAIAEIDTRRLTRLLRDKGPMNGCLLSGDALREGGEEKALEQARRFPGLKGMDLAKEVTTDTSYEWKDGLWERGVGHPESARKTPFHVVAYDFGVKRNILRHLSDRDCRVTVVPAKTSAEEVLALKPDGVFLSNGPGDPEPCDYAIAATRKFLEL